MNHLQIMHSTHSPNKPFKVEEVYKAAHYILQGASPVGIYVPKAQLLPSNTLSAEGSIKTENLGSLLAEFSKTIIEAINLNKRDQPPTSYTSTSSSSIKCNMCGGTHFIRECKVVDEYIANGKCKRNSEGKVVLPHGIFVPRSNRRILEGQDQ